RNAATLLPKIFSPPVAIPPQPLTCAEKSQARPFGCSNGPPLRWHDTNRLKPPFCVSSSAWSIRWLMQPSVVGSLTTHFSGGNEPSAARGAGEATGEVTVTKPPVALPPARASAA